MSYQVLARKWRPQTFADVVGQEHVLTALANGLSLGRIHHAYLLSGTRGVGKTTIARLLAKGLNCETGITATPCGQCDNCREIEQGRFVDLIEIDAASRTKVEDTRDLLDNVQYAPARGRFKVYLIDEVHMLSRHSFNALLKTLEEPPAHVKFLLATTDPQKLPVTILSRCLQFHLKALDVEQIRGQLSTVLQQEHIAAAPRALQLLARAADGSMRDALSLADQAIAMGQGEVSAEAVSLMLGTLNTEQPLALIEALADADGGAMMAQLAQCAARGMDWQALLLEMLSLLHRLAMGQLLPDQLNDEEDPGIVPRLRELARRLPPADLQLYYQTLLIGRKELPFAPDPRMGVEMTLLRALAFHPAAVEAAVIPANAEKKTAEFSPGAGQGGAAAGAAVASEAASADRVTSRAGVNVSPLAKGRPGAAPDIAPLAASERVPSPHGGQGRLSASDKAVGAQGGDGSDSPTRSAHAGHVAGQAAPGHKPAAGVSAPAPALTGGQTPSLPGGGAAATRQATAVDSVDESLMEAYAASGFDDDEAQAEWQPEAVMPENAEPPAPPPGGDSPLPDATAQLLQARTALLRRQESQKTKKAEPAPARQKAAVSALERLATVGERAQQRQPAAGREDSVKTPRPEAYRWRASQQPEAEPAPVTTPKALRTALEHEKTPELALSLAEEALERDPWAAQVHRLAVPKLVQQLALNAWKEDLAPGKVCLHLRASQRHLNSATAQNALRDALSADLGAPVELTVTEDDNPAMKTPLEWRQAIYEEKLMRAREAMMNDSHIQMLRRFFDAELDEDSIRPV
ncbi:DNA polymerase III subunits gamma and tau [Sodalis praecaptivus]|uniref:DNA-directed DNA polymerase n=2 Tax=Enterobacterales TaxID=91347 RepID=W0HVW9_9GAMM|nr:DNA polymerase III subunit gamma/tau [Sodalis praecaptivus]AHF77981.1 DNA polymerase III subunits gamma and tau [Sodalis praecaptivus]